MSEKALGGADVGGIGWSVDEGYAEKFGRKRRTATVELGGFGARMLHTEEEELPDGRAHHLLAYVRVEGVELGRSHGFHLGEDGLEERALEIAGEAASEARDALARLVDAASEILGGKDRA